jgi:hypothetical protein
MTTRKPGFQPGQSGNPAGRPKGARHRTALAMEALLNGEAEALTRKAIEMALDGDGPAMRLCLDRLCPPRRDRHVPFALPPITNAVDAVEASAALVAAVADGELTPSEAADLGKLIETVLRGIGLTDVQDRLARLEATT